MSITTSTQDIQNFPIVILAAGANSRFFPLNSLYHKGFTPLLGKPLVMHQIENLYRQGFRTLILVASPRDAKQEVYNAMLGTSGLTGVNLTLVEQPEALGMGDALLRARAYLPDRFAVVFPYHLNAGEVIAEMMSKSAQACVAVVETAQPWLYGIVNVADGKAVGLVEKPPQGQEPSQLKVQGLYLLNQRFVEILQALPTKEYVFETALNQLMQEERIGIHNLNQTLPSLKYPWHLLDLQQELLATQTSFIHPQAKIAQTAIIDESQGPVVIDEGATIAHASRIVGPSYIGKNAFVGDFSLVRSSDLEEHVSIGVHADITRSIFLPGASFHGGGFVGDSIIGESVKLGAGVITANKRFDRRPITTRVKDQTVATNKKALGVSIGAHAKLGVRVATMPGVMIGANQTVAAGEIVSKNLPHTESHPGGSPSDR